MKMEIDDIAKIHAAIDALEESGEEYERQVRRCYEAILKPGDVAVDVGAYEGKHTISLGFAAAPNGRVYAAEPNVGIHEVLLGRLERSRSFGVQYEMFAGCISNETLGEVKFSVVPDKVGWSSLILREGVENAQEMRVETQTMDEWVREEDHSRVRFIKVDCEGAELKVLQGAEAILAHERAIIHLEISPDALEAHGVDIEAFATSLSARYVVLDCIGMVFDTPQELAAGFRSKGCFDFFFVPRQSVSVEEDLVKLKHAMAKGFYGALTDGSLPEVQLLLAQDFWAFASPSAPVGTEEGARLGFLPRHLATLTRAQESIIHARKVSPLQRRQHCRVKNGIIIVRTANFEVLEQIPLEGRFDFELHKNGHFEIDIEGVLSEDSPSNMTMLELAIGDSFLLLLRAKWWPDKKLCHLEGLYSTWGGYKQLLAVPIDGRLCQARLIFKDRSIVVQTYHGQHIVPLPSEALDTEWVLTSATLGKRTRHRSAEPYRGKLQANLFSPQKPN